MLVLSCILSDKSTYLLAFLLVVPRLDSFHQDLIAVEYQFSDTSFVFAYQFLYVISVDEQRYMLAQRHSDGIRCIGSVLLQYLWDRFLVPSFQQTQLCHKVIIVSWLKAYFLHQIFGEFLFIVHAQPFGNIVDSRSLHLGAIPLLLHGAFSLLVPFDAQQLFFPYLEFYISELRCIHHLFLQMLLDDYCQITSLCLLVLFGNEWRTLLSVEGVPSEWLEVEVTEKGFVLGVVEFHNSSTILYRLL